MKKAKKAAALAVAAALAATNVVAFSSSAAGTFDLTAAADKEVAYTGDTVKVTVSLGSNPGVIGWSFGLKYDAAAFELTDYLPFVPEEPEQGTDESDEDYEARVEEYMKPYNEANAAYAFPEATGSPLTANPFVLLWSASDGGKKNDKTTGVVGSFEFKVLDTADVKDYDFELIVEDPDNIMDKNMDNVAYTLGKTTVSVKVAATGVEATPKSIDLKKVGDTQKITAEVKPAGAPQDVTFTSNDTSVATVAADGTVTAVAEGNTTVEVKTADGKYKDTVIVTVAHNCVGTLVPATDPTCQKEGNVAYYKCTCGKIYSDSECKNETTLAAVTLAKTAHDYVETVDAKYLKSAANCTDKAVYYKSCKFCGVASETETFESGEVDKTNHKGPITEDVNAKEPTCTAEGYTGDKVCDACGEVVTAGTNIAKKDHSPAAAWSYDDANHWKVCTLGCGTILDEAPHEAEDEATCVSKAKCKICGAEYGEVDPSNHTDVELVGYKIATETEAGYTGDFVCNDCGVTVATGKVVEPHVHQLKKIEGVDPTCELPGSKEVYECEICDAGFFDAEGTDAIDTEEEFASIIIPALGHVLETVDGVLPTCTEAGYEPHYHCTVCHKVFRDSGGLEEPYVETTEEELVRPALGHDLEDGWKYDQDVHYHTCSRCDAIIDMADHDFGEWEEFTLEDGTVVKERACKVCNYSEQEEVETSKPDDSDVSKPDDSKTEDSKTDDSSKPDSSSKTDTTSKATDSNKGGNPATGAASAFAVVTAVALGAMFITKRRK